MQEVPTKDEIQKYLADKKPLSFDGNATITDIDPKPISGHFNFLIEQGDTKAVLRMKGPEWGEPTQGIIDEYRILGHVASYHVGPQPLLLDTEGVGGEPLLFEEYLEGAIYSQLSEDAERDMIPSVTAFISGIGEISVADDLPYQEPITTYRNRPRVWRERLAVVRDISPEWYERVAELLPRAEAMLASFEPVLKRALSEHGNAFIFESAHAGHCILTDNGPRFLNWEQVSYGDPAFTLSVFLASLQGRDDFEELKKEAISAHKTYQEMPEFEALVNQRLAEREVSNLIWVLWSQAKNGKQITNEPEDRLRRVQNMLASF